MTAFGLCVLTAGCFRYSLFPFFLLFATYFSIGRNFVQIEVTSAQVQLEVGDRITSIDGVRCATLLNQLLSPESGKAMVYRKDKIISIDIVTLKRDGLKFLSEKRFGLGFAGAATFAYRDMKSLIRLYLIRFMNFRRVLSKAGGPVSIMREGMASSVDIYSFISWIILLSTVLGVFNILPIPPLDGGRIALELLHIVIPKRFHRWIDNIFNEIALLFVLSLLILIFRTDILKMGTMK